MITDDLQPLYGGCLGGEEDDGDGDDGGGGGGDGDGGGGHLDHVLFSVLSLSLSPVPSLVRPVSLSPLNWRRTAPGQPGLSVRTQRHRTSLNCIH